MKSIVAVVTLAIISVASSTSLPLNGLARGALRTTAQRIARYNYPVEVHKVQTQDGYILTMFRIPYSPKLQNKNKNRPVVFLMHGFLSSSDCWILNGPNDALAYILSDAGYDVWMGNARGNTYSRKHVKMTPILPNFWDFSWNEIAIKDLPAMIDYVLHNTNQKALHYVGHSQGTTVFFVCMSLIPSYNAKIKTAHMLAPVAYMEHMRSPLAKVAGPLLGSPNLLSGLIGSNEFMPSNKFLSMLGSKTCQDHSAFQPMCANVLFLIAGWDSKHLNYTLLPEAMETHPAGSSSNQGIHYLQEYNSGYFRKFDYGKVKNNLKYSQWSPPKYIEKNIVAPVRFYYSDNDLFADVVDVQKMQKLLPNLVESYRVPLSGWTHMDFLWALEVKEMLYNKLVRAVNYFEKTGKQ